MHLSIHNFPLDKELLLPFSQLDMSRFLYRLSLEPGDRGSEANVRLVPTRIRGSSALSDGRKKFCVKSVVDFLYAFAPDRILEIQDVKIHMQSLHLSPACEDFARYVDKLHLLECFARAFAPELVFEKHPHRLELKVRKSND